MTERVYTAVSVLTALLVLVPAGYGDIRNRTVSGRLLLAGGVVAVPLAVLQTIYIGKNWGLCMLPGVILLGLWLLFRGQPGLGDAFLALVMGLLFPGQVSALGVVYGVMLCGFAGLVLLITQKVGKEASLPLIPFLAVGYMAALIQWKHR